MSEIKDNSIELSGELANIQVKSRKDGKIMVLRIEVPSQNLSDEKVGKLFNAQGNTVGLEVLPAQTELDTDEHQEADGQTGLLDEE